MIRWAVILSICLFINDAFAQVIARNTGDRPVKMAIGMYAEGNWQTLGWIDLPPNSSKSLGNWSKYNNPNFYYCVQAVECNEGIFGQSYLYADLNDKFLIKFADQPKKYPPNGAKPVGFVAIKFQPDSTIININSNDLCKGLSTTKNSATDLVISDNSIEKEIHYEVKELPIQEYYLNGTGKAAFLGGRNRIVHYVELPRNTVEWYYQFAATADEEETLSSTFSLAKQLGTMLDLGGISSIVLSNIPTPKGNDYCNVFVMDEKYHKAFIEEGEYQYFPSISRMNFKSGNVEVKGNGQNMIIGLDNEAILTGINVSLQIVAIVRVD